MGLRFKGLKASDFAMMLKDAEREVKRDAYEAFREETEEVMKISIKQTPVDTGELEAAHKLIINRNQTDHVHLTIAVEGVINGVDVDEYSGEIHNGSYNLGKRSQDKQGAVAPHIVGPGFLSRAFDERRDAIIRRIQEVLNKGVMRNVR